MIYLILIPLALLLGISCSCLFSSNSDDRFDMNPPRPKVSLHKAPIRNKRHPRKKLNTGEKPLKPKRPSIVVIGGTGSTGPR